MTNTTLAIEGIIGIQGNSIAYTYMLHFALFFQPIIVYIGSWIINAPPGWYSSSMRASYMRWSTPIRRLTGQCGLGVMMQSWKLLGSSDTLCSPEYHNLQQLDELHWACDDPIKINTVLGPYGLLSFLLFIIFCKYLRKWLEKWLVYWIMAWIWSLLYVTKIYLHLSCSLSPCKQMTNQNAKWYLTN